jgi:putative membrane protein
MIYSALPHLNAALNGTSALLLLLGFCLIKRKNRNAHRGTMTAAFAASVLFLISYLTYHAHAGSVRFEGQGWTRLLYFAILISHSTLAAVALPMILVTLGRALRNRFDLHRRIARWTLPVWLYVSVTGVIVYLMLYHV